MKSLKRRMGVSALLTLALGANVAMAATSTSDTKQLSYQEEGMTMKRPAYHFDSIQGYSMYVMTNYLPSRQGAYDVFTMKSDPKAWFSVIKLSEDANFAKLAVPVKQHLTTVGQVNVDNSNGQLFMMATNLSTHVSEEYIYTKIHHQPFRFHIVHESDWESNAQFNAMFKTLAIAGHPTASKTTPGIFYPIRYFATNHNALAFHIGQRVFFGSTTGTLQLHVGDRVRFTQDTGAKNSLMPVDVKRVIVTSGGKSIHVTSSSASKFVFSAVKPGTVTFEFERGHSKQNGKFTVDIVSES